MLAKLLPVILMLAGTGAGIGAATFLSKPPMEKSKDQTEASKDKDAEYAKDEKSKEGAKTEFARLSNQFVVPIVAQDRVSSMVVVSLSIEVKSGTTEAIYSLEPKLRDAFLRVLFDHANMGGFAGRFTNARNLDLLRNALKEVAQKEIGPDFKNVLITDIARQDT